MATNNETKSGTGLWVIRGAPGVGKSAVGRRLRRLLGNSVVIEVDVLRGMRSDPRWTEADSHQLGLRQASRLAISYRKHGFWPVIVVDTMLDDRLDHFVENSDEKPLVFTLVAQSEALLARARSRTSGYKDEARIIEMDSALRKSALRQGFEVDTTRMTADQAVDHILGLAGAATGPSPPGGPGEGSLAPLAALGSVGAGRLILARHANAMRGFRGPYDVMPGPPLSDAGKREAAQLAGALQGERIARCIASPFARTRETAEIIVGRRMPIEEADAWAEVGPSESYPAVKERVRGWLSQRLPSNGETWLVVAHGATINAALSMLVPQAFKVAPRDGHGLATPKAGAWAIQWERGPMQLREIHRPG